MSRQPVVTPEMQEEFCAMIAVGYSRRRAARALGRNESTIRYAMQRDGVFAKRVLRNEQNRDAYWADQVQKQSAKTWHTGARLLERLDRARCAKPFNREARDRDDREPGRSKEENSCPPRSMNSDVP